MFRKLMNRSDFPPCDDAYGYSLEEFSKLKTSGILHVCVVDKWILSGLDTVHT